jgi:hypothetical protein
LVNSTPKSIAFEGLVNLKRASPFHKNVVDIINKLQIIKKYCLYAQRNDFKIKNTAFRLP